MKYILFAAKIVSKDKARLEGMPGKVKIKCVSVFCIILAAKGLLGHVSVCILHIILYWNLGEKGGDYNCNGQTPFRPFWINSHSHRINSISISGTVKRIPCHCLLNPACYKNVWFNFFSLSEQGFIKQHVTTLLPLSSVSPALSTDLWE